MTTADLIFDLDDNPIQSGQLTVDAADSVILTIRIECRTGYFLRATTADNLTVEARRVGDAGWTNIETGQLDLSAPAGSRQNYEIRLTGAAGISVRARTAFDIKVGK